MRTDPGGRTNNRCSVSTDRPVFIVEVKVAEGWQLVGSAPTRDAAATLAAAAVRRVSTEGDTYTQVRIYVATSGNDASG